MTRFISTERCQFVVTVVRSQRARMRHEKAWGADEKELKTKTTPKQARTKQIRFQTPCLHAIHTLRKERKARYYADIRILLQKIRSSKRL